MGDLSKRSSNKVYFSYFLGNRKNLTSLYTEFVDLGYTLISTTIVDAVIFTKYKTLIPLFPSVRNSKNYAQ